MVVPSSDLTRVVEQVVARFVQRYSAPPRCDHAEWRAECVGEAWGCVADVRRTFDPTRGCFTGYVARAVWQHLLDFRAREQRWARRACVSLDAPSQTADGEACERAWLDPASVEVEGMVVAEDIPTLPKVEVLGNHRSGVQGCSCFYTQLEQPVWSEIDARVRCL